MKKLFLFLAFAGVMPLSALGQDDVYFTPAKSVSKNSRENSPTYYRGSNRSVDEYNRRGRLKSYYQKIGTDSLGNDIVTYQRMSGVSPDSIYIDTAYVYPGSASFDDDYAYTRRMSRWDGFYDPWFYGAYRWGAWYNAWYDPWYYGYGGWYGAYDPWYYGYTGWYDPWYYGYSGWYGWGYPYYGYGWSDPYYYGRRYYAGVSGGTTGWRSWGAPGSNRDYSNGSGIVSNNSRYTGGTTSRSRSNRSFGSRDTYPSSSTMQNNSVFN
ncbi:MAG: hypothetical protein HXL34_07915, partial [Prevotellaceae bacterium]|nr:hypothetical protein [Prevotellaceae bacterium]